jgi:hypothetical protein
VESEAQIIALDQFNNFEVGIVASLETLRRVLKGLTVNGKRWWIGCDPRDAVENEAIMVGFGDPRCTDPLNRSYFRMPVLEAASARTTGQLLLLIAPSTIVSDDIAEFEEFYAPVKNVLLERIRVGD